MGSWNETDALTKLPILEDEEIVLFVLGGQSTEFVEPDRFIAEEAYQPIGLPFYGQYDGYGSIILDPEKAEYHQEFINKRITEPSITNPEEFFEAFTEESLGSAWRGGVYTQMMVRKSGWETLLQAIGDTQKPYDAPKTWREHYTDLVDEYAIATMKMDGPDAFLARQFIGDKFSASQFWGTVTHYFENGISEEAKENAVRLLLTNDLLKHLRIGWTPQYGSGSQSTNTKFAQMLADITVQEINMIRMSEILL
jgi:hypothetical protein